MQHVQDILNKLDATNLSAAAVVVEIVLRLVKTDKPLSLLYMVADGLGAVAKIATTAADILNKVIPQRLK